MKKFTTLTQDLGCLSIICGSTIGLEIFLFESIILIASCRPFINNYNPFAAPADPAAIAPLRIQDLVIRM